MFGPDTWGLWGCVTAVGAVAHDEEANSLGLLILISLSRLALLLIVKTRILGHGV